MLEDQEIIFRVQCGERELFGELHARHNEQIFRFISREVWQRESAQDLTSEVWVRAYRAVDRFQVRAGTSVLAWLMRIAANLVTDYRRRLGPDTEPWDDNEDIPSPFLMAPPTESQFWKRERSRAIHAAFCELSDADRQIIALAHGQDYTSLQIARMLDKPSISATTSHLHRAMTHLREKLSRSGWFDNSEVEWARA